MTDCAACQALNAKNRCGGCKLVYYCNTDCQRKHWKVHKKECNFKKKKKKKIPIKSRKNDDTKPDKVKENNINDEDKKTDNDYIAKDIKETLEFIADNTQKYLLRLDAVSALLQPPDPNKFGQIEKQGLWATYDKVLEFAYNYLKEIKDDTMSQNRLNIQMMVQNFTSAIVMNKEGTYDGTDTCIEANCLKLLHHTNFWRRHLEMIGMKQCHIEYKRGFFRIFTLILNFKSCGQYILENLTDIKKNKEQGMQLNNLISLCEDDVDCVANNALQGLANQCFCQLYIHCQQLNIRQDLLNYLDTKKNVYFHHMYAMSKAQMSKKSALSLDDMNEILKKQNNENM